MPSCFLGSTQRLRPRRCLLIRNLIQENQDQAVLKLSLLAWKDPLTMIIQCDACIGRACLVIRLSSLYHHSISQSTDGYSPAISDIEGRASSFRLWGSLLTCKKSPSPLILLAARTQPYYSAGGASAIRSNSFQVSIVSRNPEPEDLQDD